MEPGRISMRSEILKYFSATYKKYQYDCPSSFLSLRLSDRAIQVVLTCLLGLCSRISHQSQTSKFGNCPR